MYDKTNSGYSKAVNVRSKYSALAKLMEEVGEMALEASIENGSSYKEPGDDGVIGELADVIITAIDVAYLQDNQITEEQIQASISFKLEKWKLKRGLKPV